MKKIFTVVATLVIAAMTLSLSAFAATTKNLSSLKPISTDRYTGNMGDSFIDSLGTRNGFTGTDGKTYKNGLEAWVARWNYKSEKSWAKATYKIDGEYDLLTGKIVIIDDSYNTNNFDMTVEINGDGKLIKQYKIVPSNKSKSVKLDVSGVKKLEISVYDNIAVSGGTSLGLVNFMLSKNVTDKIITNISSATMNKGMTLAVTTDTSSKDKLVWKSSNPKIATVSSTGVITAVKSGTVTITVSAANGKTAKIKITVR